MGSEYDADDEMSRSLAVYRREDVEKACKLKDLSVMSAVLQAISNPAQRSTKVVDKSQEVEERSRVELSQNVYLFKISTTYARSLSYTLGSSKPQTNNAASISTNPCGSTTIGSPN